MDSFIYSSINPVTLFVKFSGLPRTYCAVYPCELLYIRCSVAVYKPDRSRDGGMTEGSAI